MYQKANAISACIMIALVPFLGIIGDRTPVTVLVPLAYALRATTCYLFLVTNDPESMLATLLVTLLDVFSAFETISVNVIFFSIVPRELRGIMMAGMGISSQSGKLLFTAVGGVSFDLLGRNGPQIYQGTMDILMVLLALIYLKFGRLKRDE